MKSKILPGLIILVSLLTQTLSLYSQEKAKDFYLASGQAVTVMPDGKVIVNEKKGSIKKLFRKYSDQSVLSAAEVSLINKIILELAELELQYFKDSLQIEKDLKDMAQLKSRKLIDQSTYDKEYEVLVKSKSVNELEKNKLTHYFRKIAIIDQINLKSRENFYNELYDYGLERGQEWPRIPQNVWISRDIIIDERPAHAIVDQCALHPIVNTKSKIIGHQSDFQFIFGYTHQNLRPHLKMKDFLETFVSVTKESGDWYLDVEFRFESRDVKRSYGKLKRGDFLRFLFLNGKKMFLRHAKDIEGKLEEDTGKMIYNVRYALSTEQVSMFTESEIDEAGVMWESGFEEYKVFRITTIMDQINCIQNAK